MSRWTYFEKNETSGDPNDLVMIDTSNFSEAEWFELQCVEDQQSAAIEIAKNRNASIISVRIE